MAARALWRRDDRGGRPRWAWACGGRPPPGPRGRSARTSRSAGPARFPRPPHVLPPCRRPSESVRRQPWSALAALEVSSADVGALPGAAARGQPFDALRLLPARARLRGASRSPRFSPRPTPPRPARHRGSGPSMRPHRRRETPQLVDASLRGEAGRPPDAAAPLAGRPGRGPWRSAWIWRGWPGTRPGARGSRGGSHRWRWGRWRSGPAPRSSTPRRPR